MKIRNYCFIVIALMLLFSGVILVQGLSCSEESDCANSSASCVNGQCECWNNHKTGDYCDTCIRGYVGSNCDNCAPGFTKDPQDGSTCLANCNPSCYRGDCVGTNECECNTGWAGATCNVCANGYSGTDAFGNLLCDVKTCVPGCGYHGKCDIPPSTCKCDYGWEGAVCNIPQCYGNYACGNNSYCSSAFECSCVDGYNKTDAGCVMNVYNCPAPCGDNMKCNSSLLCACEAGYDLVNGVCYSACPSNSYRSGTSCVCFSGYSLNNGVCEKECSPECTNGVCSDGVCVCNSGFDKKGGVCYNTCSAFTGTIGAPCAIGATCKANGPFYSCSCSVSGLEEFNGICRAPCNPVCGENAECNEKSVCQCKSILDQSKYSFDNATKKCYPNCTKCTLAHQTCNSPDDANCFCDRVRGYLPVYDYNSVVISCEKPCSPACMGNSHCVNGDHCECDVGYTDYGNEYGCVKTCSSSCIGLSWCSDAICYCPGGYQQHSNSTSVWCEPICTSPCGANKECSAPENCTCKVGYEPIGNECYSACPSNSYRSGTNCVCFSGYSLNNGVCEKECSPECTNGVCSDGVCVCNSGFEKKGGLCYKTCSAFTGTIGAPCAIGATCKANGPFYSCSCSVSGLEEFNGICRAPCNPVCGENAECNEKSVCQCKSILDQSKYSFDNATKKCYPNCTKCTLAHQTCNSPDDANCFCDRVRGYLPVYDYNSVVISCEKPCSPACMGNSHCVNGDHCECDIGFTDYGNEYGCVKTCSSSCIGLSWCSDAICYCPGGYQQHSNSTSVWCEPICTSPCGANKECSAPENCTCKVGYEPIGNECYSACPSNSYRSGTNCVCFSGYSLNNGVCEKECSPECTNGVCSDGVCVCNSGFEKKGGVCYKTCSAFTGTIGAPCAIGATCKANGPFYSCSCSVSGLEEFNGVCRAPCNPVCGENAECNEKSVCQCKSILDQSKYSFDNATKKCYPNCTKCSLAHQTCNSPDDANCFCDRVRGYLPVYDYNSVVISCEKPCSPACMGNSHCVNGDHCECDIGYTDYGNEYSCVKTCSSACIGLSWCSDAICYCPGGYQQHSNSTSVWCEPICTSPCGANKECSAPENCTCKVGFDDVKGVCVESCRVGYSRAEDDDKCYANCKVCGAHSSCYHSECVCDLGYLLDARGGCSSINDNSSTIDNTTTGNSSSSACDPICDPVTSSCVDGVCICKQNLEMIGGACVYICTLDCGPHGICENTTGSATCKCSDFFEGTTCSSCKSGFTLMNEQCICDVASGSALVGEDCICNSVASFKQVGSKCVRSEPTCINGCGNGICRFVNNITSESECVCSSGFISTYQAKCNDCDSNQGLILSNGLCVCNVKLGFRLSTMDGKCQISSPVCADKCGNGECQFVDSTTDLAECKCNVGYMTIRGSGKMCSECSTGYALSNGVCKLNCTQDYYGDDCSTYIPTAACVSPPTNSLSFCNSVVSYQVKNTLYIQGAQNPSQAKEMFFNNIKATDEAARTVLSQVLKEFAQQNMSCDSNCIAVITKSICYQYISSCYVNDTNAVEKKLCKSTCNYILNNEVVTYPDIYANSCDRLPETNCFYGTYLPPSTSCYGIPYLNSSVCSGKGRCVGTDLCSCGQGYTGRICELPICFNIDSSDKLVCSSNGECVGVNKCNCKPYFTGKDCSIISCNGKSEAEGGCSFHGKCSADHKCICSGNFVGTSCSECAQGFTGVNCDIPICNGINANDKLVCSSRGSCVVEGGKPICTCSPGYSGTNCQTFKCNDIDRSSSDVCSKRGKCVAQNSCVCAGNFDPLSYCSTCTPAFNGSDCTDRICSDELTCSSHGKCNSNFKCDCQGNWVGDFCNQCKEGFVGTNCQFECSSATKCNGKGSCNMDGTCQCKGNNVGTNCEQCTNDWFGAKCDFSIDSSSFGFSTKGDSIYGTVYSTLKKKFACSEIVTTTDILGTGAVCVLNPEKSTMEIILGLSASVKIGSILQFKKYFDSLETTQVTILSKDYVSVAPLATLVSDKPSISKACGKVYLDASSSVSIDRRTLFFSWSNIAAPTTQDVDNLNAILSSVTSSGVYIGGAELSVGSYSFQVTVTSSFSLEKSSATVSIDVSDLTSPTVTIKEGLESSLIIGKSSVITPTITFPSCYKGEGPITYVYTLDTTKSINVKVKQKGELLVFSDDYTKITEEGDYYFVLTTNQQGAADVRVPFKVTAKALPLVVSFSVRDMVQSFENDVTFTIITRDPSNPSVPAGGDVVLSCTNLDTATTCDGFSNSASNINQTTLNFKQGMQPGTYLFTSTYTKGSRKSQSSVKVTILDKPKSTIIRVLVSPPKIADLTAIDPSTDLVLQASTMDTLGSERVFKWTSDDIDFTSILTSSKYIVIPKSSLVPGTFNTVKVKIVDGTRSGEAEISFSVNSPPTQGILEVTPYKGIALSDEFQIKCGNGWYDVQLPLSFKFMYKEENQTTWKTLSEQSEKRSLATPLPFGVLQIKAIVYDSLGASTESITTVTTTLPDTIEALNMLTTQQGSITVSSLSSALSVIGSLTGLTTDQKAAMQEASKSFVNKYFEQQAQKESLVEESSSSSSSKISVISSIINSVKNIPDNTVSMVIEKFFQTMNSASTSSSISMSTDDINSSTKSANSLREHVTQNLAKRKLSSFTKADLKKIDNIYASLISIQVKSSVADMPATRGVGVDSNTYARLVSIPTLNGLSELVKDQGVSSFKLSSTFGENTKIKSLDSVKLSAKISLLDTTSSLKAATKVFALGISDSDTNIIVQNSQSIASLTIERISNRRSNMDFILKCFSLQNNDYASDSSCSISSVANSNIVISVQSTGSYVVVELPSPTNSLVQPTPSVSGPTPTHSTTPQTSKGSTKIPTSWPNLDYIALILLIIPVLLVVVGIIGLSVWMMKKKKNSNKDANLVELRSV